MRARAFIKDIDHNPAKVWEEGETREDVIKNIIHRELWNTWTASALFQQITRDPRPLDEVHDGCIKHYTEHEGDVIPFEVVWEDGTTESLDINCSSVAVHNAVVTLTDLGL